MSSYTSVFGGNTIYPSDVSYSAPSLLVDLDLEWPLESSGGLPASRIVDITANVAGRSVTLPDASRVSVGQTIFFNSLTGSTVPFTVKSFTGATLATIAAGEQWQLYLAGTDTSAGVWRVFRFGASTATVQASALAGYGLTVTSSLLSQSTPVTTFNSSPYAALASDRAGILVWTGTGAATINMPTTSSVGNNYYVSARNAGGGALTIDPAGSETVDGAATLLLQPGDSTTLTTNGLTWYSLGLGQKPAFAFDFTTIPVTGGTYTLAGAELNRIAYRLTGVLTSDLIVQVPSTVQQYWVANDTTGAFVVRLRAGGSGPLVSIGQGQRGIFYCNGTTFLDADTSTVALPISASDGGTGVVSYSVGDLLVASAATVLSKLAGVAVGNSLLSGGVGSPLAWGKVGLTTHVTGTLPAANGGTGAATLTGYTKGNGTGAFTASATIPSTDVTGLSGMAFQSAGNVSIVGGIVNGTAVGATTPSTGAFTTLSASALTGYTKGNGTSAFTASATIPAADVTGLATVATSGSFASLSNKPGIRSNSQNVVTVSRTLGATDNGTNLRILTTGITITFPTSGFGSGEGLAIANVSGGSVTLSAPGGADFGGTLPNSGSLFVFCDGSGFWRQYCYSTSRL